MPELKIMIMTFLAFAIGGALVGAALSRLVRTRNKLVHELIFSGCALSGMSLGVFNQMFKWVA